MNNSQQVAIKELIRLGQISPDDPRLSGISQQPEIAPAPEQQPTSQTEAIQELIRLGQIDPSDPRLASVSQPGMDQQKVEPKEWQKFLKGLIATGPAEMVDLLKIPMQSMANDKGNPELGESVRRFLENEWPKNLPQQAGQMFHDITGIPEKEEGAEPGWSEEAGKFASPLPFEKLKVAGNLIKAVPQVLGKVARRLGESYGASGAIKALPNISEEGSLPENLAKGIIGGGLGRGLTGVALSPLKSAKTAAAKTISLGSEPNVEALKLAEKHGIELPLNVGMNSTPLNFTSNLLSKTVLSSKKFKESYHKSNKSMLDAVNKNIDTLGKTDVEPSVASKEFSDFLVNEEKGVKKVVDSQYDKARALVKEGDSVVPSNTAKTIHAMKEVLTRDIKSPETSKVASYVAKLADAWGLMPKGIKLGKGDDWLAKNPKAMSMILDSVEKNVKAIPVQKLEGVRSEIGKILGHPQEVYGMEKWLRGLQNSIGHDLETSANKQYTQEIKKANNFFRESYASRFKDDLAESIMTGKEPLYTFNKLKDTHTLNTLEKMAGESPKAKEVVNNLKKARVRQIFNNALTDEGIKTGNFTRIFDKSEVDQEFLKGLLGHESYKNMNEISKIMHEQMKAGRELLNTSGTAHTASDLGKISKFGTEVTVGLTALFSGHPVVALSALGAAAAKVAVPNVVSRLMADEAFVKQARAFAVARKSGNMKYSDQLLEGLGKRANQILKTTTYTASKKEKEGED